MADSISRWLRCKLGDTFSVAGIMSTTEFASLIGSPLGAELGKAVKLLMYCTSHIRNGSEIYNENTADLAAIVNRSGVLVLRHLQHLLWARSLEKLSRDASLVLFLTVVATIIVVKYHQIPTIRH